MATVSKHLHTWKLKLKTTKTVSAVFHLNNKEAKGELNVNHNNETLVFCSEPKYLGVTLDRSLTYRRHLESLRKKLTSRVALLRRLAGTGWGAGVTSLRTATLALVHSATDYCSTVCGMWPQCSPPPLWPYHQRRQEIKGNCKIFMSLIEQVNKDFALCVLTETSSTLDVLLQCLKCVNRPSCY